jgi:large subunit ribosomal protein L21
MHQHPLENAMYAVLSSGGKQYRVEPGSTVLMERLPSEPGASILFDRVLLIGDGDDVTVGTPVVSGATVSGTVLGEELGPKLVIFKFKQKVKYRRRTGHRQHLLRVRIDEINAEGRGKSPAKAKPEPEKAEPAEAATEAAAAPSKPRASRARTAKPKAEASAKTAADASVQDEAPKKRTTRRAAVKTGEAPADATDKAADEAKE